MVSTHDDCPLLQSAIYGSLRVLGVIGGLVAIFVFTPGFAIAWMISMGIAGAIVVRLPSRWFGHSPTKVKT